MKIGYARVSTLEQNLDLQMDELKRYGCEQIITDKLGGAVEKRPGLLKLKEVLQPGDTLVVYKLDRLGRTTRHLIEFVEELKNKCIDFVSLKESIDTTSAAGRLIFNVFASISEFDRDVIRERTISGLAAARARGRMGGRPKKLDKEKRKIVHDLYKRSDVSIKEICETIGISAPTVYKYAREIDRLNRTSNQ